MSTTSCRHVCVVWANSGVGKLTSTSSTAHSTLFRLHIYLVLRYVALRCTACGLLCCCSSLRAYRTAWAVCVVCVWHNSQTRSHHMSCPEPLLCTLYSILKAFNTVRHACTTLVEEWESEREITMVAATALRFVAAALCLILFMAIVRVSRFSPPSELPFDFIQLPRSVCPLQRPSVWKQLAYEAALH